MKIEKGMYVRTDTGLICKILNRDENREFNKIELDNGIGWCSCDSNFKKASHNIIDLIELRTKEHRGDLVNMREVCSIERDECGDYLLDYNGLPIAEEATIKIEDVMTHEQYKKYAYEVVE